MRISDWSSDVCSSDLAAAHLRAQGEAAIFGRHGPWHALGADQRRASEFPPRPNDIGQARPLGDGEDRKSVVSGKSVSVRVDLGGVRIIQQKTTKKQQRERANKNTAQYKSIRST